MGGGSGKPFDFGSTWGSGQLPLNYTIIKIPQEATDFKILQELSRKDELMSNAQTQQTKTIINELYRSGSIIGDGGTADAIREELLKGKLVGGKSHIQKGKERAKQIEKILRRNPNHPDKQILELLLNDLLDALGDNYDS